jgi:tetratricopeptide (TPR) repeat protein/DNA-binding winged helix-turn-helix (wHTH) protein
VDHVLRYQTFHVLLFLLKNAGRVVSKDELTAEIWRDATVTENALTQCIAEIRKALGDDSRNPIYIRTVSKIGYQFIAPVEMITDQATEPFPIGMASITPLPLTSSLSTISPKIEVIPTKVGRRPLPGGRLAIFSALLGLLAIAALLIWGIAKSHPRVADSGAAIAPLTDGRSLAVMYFENESQSRDYDWLRQGLTDMMITDISRSGELHVLSRQQLSLLMNVKDVKDGEGAVDQAARVARMVHATDFLTGSFTALAGHFRIDIQLHDSRTGQIVFADHSIFQDSSEILSQIDVLAAHLGGAMSLNNSPRPNIAEATTKNVEAYQYYSLGVEKTQQFENAQARDLLKQAIALDPNFAMAYARIGYTYALADFDPEKGRPYLQKALQLSAHLPEKDRLYINSWYAISKGDYGAASRILYQIIRLYPQETEAYWRLARLLRAEERPEEALRILNTGLASTPNDKNLNNTLGFVLMSLRRFPEAIAAERRYIAIAPDEPNSHDSLGMAYEQSGDYPSALVEYSNALSLNSQFEPSIVHLGDVYYQTGQYPKAIEQYKRYVQVTRTEHAQALGYGDLTAVYLAMGRRAQAEEAASLELKNNPGAVWNSLVIAMLKSDEPAQRRLEAMLGKDIPSQERGTPGDLRTRFYYLGYIAFQRGQTQKALDLFRTALRHLPPTSGMDIYEDCLANAELKLGRYQEAAEEYRRILRFNPNYPSANARLQLAEQRSASPHSAGS